MIVVDASVLVAHLDASDAHHRAATELLAATKKPLRASPLTLAEVFVAPARAGRLSTAQTALHALKVREVPIGDDAASRLATLRGETGLKLPDCCVLLAAQHVGARSIMTFDDCLRTEARRSGLAAP